MRVSEQSMSQADVLQFYSRSKLWAKTHRADIVALFLASEISRWGLEEGEQVPFNERNIANSLGVGRQAVNQAWRLLASAGIVKFQRGVGVVILDHEGVVPDAASLEVYFQIRKKAEIQMARLAAKNATRDDINVMQVAIDELAKVVSDLGQIDTASPDHSTARAVGILRLLLSDLRFHVAAREAAKDSWLQIIGEIAEAKTQAMRLAGLGTPGHLEDIVESHRAVFDAIRAQQEDDAETAMEKHFELALEMNMVVLEKQ